MEVGQKLYSCRAVMVRPAGTAASLTFLVFSLQLYSSTASVPFASAQKLGLSSSFGDVTVQNMKVGTPYPLHKLKGHGYSLTNISEVPVELVVDVVPPISGTVRPLYEEIPDVSWVKVAPKQFKLDSGKAAEGEVTIRVPDNPHWKDRNFQCALYAHTLQGSFVNVGIYDKLLFSTGPGPDAMKAKGPHLAVVPGALRLGRLRVGQVHGSAAAPARLRVRNASDAAVKVTLAPVPVAGAAKPPKGFAAAPDPAALRFGDQPVEAGAWQTADAAFDLDLTRQAAGKKWAYRVRASTEGGASSSAYAWVLVEGAPEPSPAPKAVKAPKKKG